MQGRVHACNPHLCEAIPIHIPTQPNQPLCNVITPAILFFFRFLEGADSKCSGVREFLGSWYITEWANHPASCKTHNLPCAPHTKYPKSDTADLKPETHVSACSPAHSSLVHKWSSLPVGSWPQPHLPHHNLHCPQLIIHRGGVGGGGVEGGFIEFHMTTI